MENLPQHQSQSEIEVEITEHFMPLFVRDHPEAKKMFKVLRGGRGGMKTHQIASALIIGGYYKYDKILCGREFQNSIADSVHAILSQQIAKNNLGWFYRVLDHSIIGQNGTEFIFKGLKTNINSVKSFHGITKLWIEEAHTISRASIDVLFPTIRANDVEFIFSYNPDLDSDPIHQYIASLPPELVYIAETTWEDNPWLSESLRIQKDLQLRRIAEATTDEERAIEQMAYDHVWGGKTRKNSRSQIFAGKCITQDFEAVKGDDGLWRINGDVADGPYYGVDWGFSVDPLAAVRCWIAGECLYIDHEIYAHQVETEETPKLLKTIPGLANHTVRADSARPETISHCAKQRRDEHGVLQPGLDIVGVEKWKGSVEDGITVLKGFKKIVIHSRCPNMQNEARLYSFKVDQKTGDILTDIVDKFNHLWDAVRYALGPYIQRSGPGMGYLEFYQRQFEHAKQAELQAKK